jgi:hypothetical protein
LTRQTYWTIKIECDNSVLWPYKKAMHAASQRSCGVWKRSSSKSSTSAPHKHATTIGGGSALPHPQINAPIAPCARLNGSPTNPRSAGVTAVAALPVQAMAAAAAALGAAALGAAALAWRAAAKAAGRPELIYDKEGASDGGFMAAVLAHCPTLQSEYRPLPFLSNGHVRLCFCLGFGRFACMPSCCMCVCQDTAMNRPHTCTHTCINN